MGMSSGGILVLWNGGGGSGDKYRVAGGVRAIEGMLYSGELVLWDDCVAL